MDEKYVSFSVDNCCGCTACFSVCPKNAITMVENEKGYKYPEVNTELCVNCGLCKNVCDFNKTEHFHHSEQPIAAYGIKHLDSAVRAESRSGGVFTAVTDAILDKGGCVFGAVLDDDFVVHHVKCESRNERDRLRGSKYVQSDMGGIYREVEKELKTGRLVAFSGTGCQVAGLQSFLRKEYDNLYTFDIVCHGVPSPKVFREYISYVEKKYGKISNFNFRDKSILGWDMHIESFIAKGKKHISRTYSNLFTTNFNIRDCCYNCKYTNMSRPGDFTLADFWRVDEHFPGFNDNKGVSLLFVNSTKAESLFKDILDKNLLDCKKCEKMSFSQPQLHEPTKKPGGYNEFWNEYCNNGFECIIKKYSSDNKKIAFQTKKILIKRFIKRKIFKRI